MSSIPGRIQWHSGLLVTPTSQRQISERFEALVQALPGRYQPFYWGVTRDVEYDADALTAGVLKVHALDAVMRNGFHVTVDGRAGLQLPLALADGHTQIVRVALDDDAAEARRFVPCGAAAQDPAVGEDGVEIPFLKPRLVLYPDHTPDPRPETSFPLCEVQRHGGSYRVTDFLPPTLQVTSDSRLGLRCGSIPQLLRGEVSTVTDRTRVHPIVSALPAFESLLGVAPHPSALYVELSRLAGAAAVLRGREVPTAFPRYDHDAAEVAFKKVIGYVMGETDAMASGPFLQFTFEFDGVWFRLPADPAWTHAMTSDSASQLILAVESSDLEAQRWGEQCVIATQSVAQSMLARRVLGCERQRVTPGTALPPRADRHLFRITPDAETARPGEDLLVLGGLGGMQPSALHLYLVGPHRRDSLG